jgi:hypothetical protein
MYYVLAGLGILAAPAAVVLMVWGFMLTAAAAAMP